MRRFQHVRTSTLASLVLLFICAAGCSKSLYGWQVRTNSTPVAPSFNQTPVEQKRMAIFSTLAPGMLQGTAEGMSQYLGETLHKLIPALKVMTEQETLTMVNRHGLGVEYTKMRFDAEESHLLNRGTLAKIGTALGVQYFLQPRLANFTQIMTDRMKVPGFDLRVLQTRSSLLRISLQLWEAESGELIWASVAETIMESEAITQDPVFLEDAVRLTFGSLLEDFINRRTASKYTPLNDVLNTLVHTAIPEEKPDKVSGGADKEK
jgi:hypothetical protein